MVSAILSVHFSVDCLPQPTVRTSVCFHDKGNKQESNGYSCSHLLAAGLIPKFSSLLTYHTYCVLGGATISVFASIAMTGMKLIASEELNFRNTTIVGLAIAVGMGVTQASASLAQFPDWVTTIFGKSPVVLATISAIVLNLILPKQLDPKTK